MSNRESFVFYKSFMDAVDTVSSVKYKYYLLESIIKVGLFSGESIEKLETFCEESEQKLAKNPQVLGMFLAIKPQLFANYKKYLNGCKGSAYGKFGGAPEGNKNAKKQPQNNPKTTPNVNEECIMNNVNEECIMNNELGVVCDAEKKIEIPEIDFAKLAAFWNTKTKGIFSPVKVIPPTSHLAESVRRRAMSYGTQAIEQAIIRATESEWLQTRGFFSFQWLFETDLNFGKVLNGNFINKNQHGTEKNTRPQISQNPDDFPALG